MTFMLEKKDHFPKLWTNFQILSKIIYTSLGCV